MSVCVKKGKEGGRWREKESFRVSRNRDRQQKRETETEIGQE